MNEYTIRDIEIGSVFSAPVFLEDGSGVSPDGGKADAAGGFLITLPPLPVSPALKAALLEWEWRAVYSDGKMQAEGEGASRKAPPEIDALNTEERFAVAGETYKRLVDFAGEVFAVMESSGAALNYAETAEKMAAFIKLIDAGPEYIIRVAENAKISPAGGIRVEHGVKTAIVALLIAREMGFSPAEITELGLAALLHEIELSVFPPDMLNAGRETALARQKLLYTHPVLGYRKLNARGFPPSVCRAVLEHHEMLDGSGYPQRLSGDKIGLPARVLACACACFEAPEHPAAGGLRANLAQLFRTPAGKYDAEALRALQDAVLKRL